MNLRRLMAILFVLVLIIALVLVSCVGRSSGGSGDEYGNGYDEEPAVPTIALPTQTPIPEPTEEPAQPAEEPEEPAEEPETEEPDAEPEEPVEEPEAEPTEEPAPTPEPTVEPEEEPTPEPTPVPSDSSSTDKGEQRTYIVRRGDTLWSIARRMYGNAKRWGDIYEANRDIIRNPRRIYPKMELVIP